MGFGHIYVDADQAAVIAVLTRHVASKGMSPIEMTFDRHPDKMKTIHEAELRLLWISPRLGKWTGIFEFRYYANEYRERWGYTDEELALALSKELGPVYRMEVLDGAGFWLYAKYEKGAETAGSAYQDSIIDQEPDPGHHRFELNRIIDREGIRNIGVGYENIPGPQVRPVEQIPQRSDGIEGLDEFVHLAFQGTRKASDAGQIH
jgi:hypothetical protein